MYTYILQESPRRTSNIWMEHKFLEKFDQNSNEKIIWRVKTVKKDEKIFMKKL